SDRHRKQLLVSGPDAPDTDVFVAYDAGQIAAQKHRNVEQRANPVRGEIGRGKFVCTRISVRVVGRNRLAAAEGLEIAWEINSGENRAGFVAILVAEIQGVAPNRVRGLRQRPEADARDAERRRIELQDFAE